MSAPNIEPIFDSVEYTNSSDLEKEINNRVDNFFQPLIGKNQELLPILKKALARELFNYFRQDCKYEKIKDRITNILTNLKKFLEDNNEDNKKKLIAAINDKMCSDMLLNAHWFILGLLFLNLSAAGVCGLLNFIGAIIRVHILPFDYLFSFASAALCLMLVACLLEPRGIADAMKTINTPEIKQFCSYDKNLTLGDSAEKQEELSSGMACINHI